MKKLEAKHIVWVILAALSLTAIVLLEVFSDSTLSEKILWFLAGLIIPGSPLGRSGGGGGSGSGGAAALVVVLSFFLGGCGGGAITTHARAAIVTSSAVTAVEGALHDARAAELDACRDEACLDAGEARWEPVVGSYNVLVVALAGWVSTLELVRLSEQDDASILGILLRSADAAMTAYIDLMHALASFGLSLPDPTPVLTMLGLSFRPPALAE